MTQLALRCRCGSLQGTLDVEGPGSGRRLICYCDDCQTAAKYFGQPDLLDPHGGTEVFQTTPSHIRLTAGTQHLACLRLSPKGLMRWHASCCSTPIANTLNLPGLPFASVLRSFFEHDLEVGSDELLLGPVRARIQGRFAVGGVPSGASARAPVSFILDALVRLAVDAARGRARPSPFFDPVSGAPNVEPLVLSREQREACRPPTAGPSAHGAGQTPSPQ